MKIEYTKHASDKMTLLGIDKRDVNEVVTKGTKWLERGEWHAFLGGIEVVFIKENSTIRIITVYYEKW